MYMQSFIIKNKRASGQEFLSPWNILIWILVGGLVVLGVLSFYSSASNTKYLESEIIVKRVADCIILGDQITPALFEEDFDIFSKCSLNKKALEESNYFYFFINVLDFSENSKLVERTLLEIGPSDYLAQAGLQSDKFAECYLRDVYGFHEEKSVENDGSKLVQSIVRIGACSNQEGKSI